MTISAAPAIPSASRARRSARRTHVQHLIAADEASLADLELLLATLPLCATGRVFIETSDADSIAPVQAPARMTVTWLDRSRRTGAPGTSRPCVRGEALARAVTAWADEMLCGDAADDGTRVDLLAGFVATADIVDHLTERCGVRADAIRTPRQYGLETAR